MIREILKILFAIVLTGMIVILKSSCKKEDEEVSLIVTDIDGNKYNTVKIGTQVWFAENLKTTKFNDNSLIPLVTGAAEWDNLKTPAFCWYNNDKNTYEDPYGALYNWYSVETSRLCPLGWHVPTESEWTKLTDFIAGKGYSGNEGSVLKSTDSWYNEKNGTDDYGFKGLPGGYRTFNGSADGFNESIGKSGHWWSSTGHFSNTDANYLSLYYFENKAILYHLYKTNGISVRCIKD